MATLDSLGLGALGNFGLSQANAGIIQFITVIIWSVIVLMIVGAAWFMITWRHRATILNESGKKVGKDFVRLKTEKDGYVIWKVLKARTDLPNPPDRIVNAGPFGTYHIFLCRNSHGQLIFAENKISTVPVMPESIQQEKDVKVKAKLKREWMKDNCVPAFEPISASMRQAYINQLQRSKQEEKKTKTEMFIQLAPLTLLAMCFVVGLLFAGDAMQAVTAPGRAAQESYQDFVRDITDATLELEALRSDIALGVQRLKPEVPPS